MDKNFATGWLHLCPALLLLDVAAPLAAGDQLSGIYASTPVIFGKVRIPRKRPSGRDVAAGRNLRI